MKKLIIAVLLSVPCAARAQSLATVTGTAVAPTATLSVPGVTGSLDLTSFIKSLHPVYVYDQHGDSLSGADLHVVSCHSASGTDWANVNAGVVWRVSDGVGGPMASVRLRWDNLWANAVGTSWSQSHLTAIKVPQVEAGPFGGYINRLGWIYGVTAALAF